MFIFTKFVAVCCAFFLGITLLLDIALVLVLKIVGAVGFAYVRWSWLVLFSFIWLASFLLAWQTFIVPKLARFK
jgi:hypothetical protein